MKGVRLLLGGCIVLVFCLYFLHLAADFPDVARWNDWARYTDEGWYSAAAIQHARTGHWYQPGAFNAAVALPVWPLLLRAWFAVADASMESARALAILLTGGSLLLLYRLLRRSVSQAVALSALLLLLLSPYTYAFNRTAVLEPLVTFLFLLALTVCTLRLPSWARAVIVGILLCLMVLTKTPAVTFAPAILLFLRDQLLPPEAPRRSLQRPAPLLGPILAVCVAASLYAAWFLLIIRPRYQADFANLFAINRSHAHLSILPRTVVLAALDLRTISGIFAALTGVLLLASLTVLRRLWYDPLFRAAALALACYVFYLGWHAWRSPRYEAPCTVLLATLLAIGLPRLSAWPAAHWLATASVAVAAVLMACQTGRYIAHPAYTFRDASASIAHHIAHTPTATPVLCSPSSDDIALYSSIRAWNPTWPTQPLTSLVRATPTGWYAAWTPQEAILPGAITGRYLPQQVDSYTVMPDQSHQHLVLYRLIPRAETP